MPDEHPGRRSRSAQDRLRRGCSPSSTDGAADGPAPHGAIWWPIATTFVGLGVLLVPFQHDAVVVVTRVALVAVVPALLVSVARPASSGRAGGSLTTLRDWAWCVVLGVAAVGWLATAGPSALLAAGLLAVTSPLVLPSLAAGAGGRGDGGRGEPPRAEQVGGGRPPTVVLIGGELGRDVSEMSTAELVAAWRRTDHLLGRCPDATAARRIVQLRAAYLDELSRRDAGALERWIAASPRQRDPRLFFGP